MTALIDTGASVSMMCGKVARELGLELKEESSNKIWKTASGDVLHVYGTVHTTVQIGNLETPAEFFIKDKLSPHIIIGLDFIKSNKMELNFKENLIRIFKRIFKNIRIAILFFKFKFSGMNSNQIKLIF